MRKNLRAAIVVGCIALLGGWLFTACNERPSAGAASPAAATQWEYCNFFIAGEVEVYYADKTIKAQDYRDAVQKLGGKSIDKVDPQTQIANVLGADGWEFVQRDNSGCNMSFRRPKR